MMTSFSRYMHKTEKHALFEHVLSRLNLSPGGVYTILDFGCGTGDVLGLVSGRVGADSKLFGLDAAERSIRAACERHQGVTYICKKFESQLDFPEAMFDIIITIDAIECINDKCALINEFHRILKPRGKLFAAHWDWDTMLYNSESKDFARKAVAAFSDWKQPWMDDCDGQMGRKLWGLFEGSGKFRGEPGSFTLVETKYRPATYGFDRMRDIAKLIDKGIGKEEYQTLHRELIKKDKEGSYFCSLTSFIYRGEKI